MSGLPKAFLDDIVANIDDDTPRLVYADWLEENGQSARAEFIHVQIERSRLPAWDAAQVDLRLREQRLLAMHGEEWLAELPTVKGAKWEGFRRGIVAEVSFESFEAMRENAHTCRAIAPVEAVTVHWPRKREGQKSVKPIAELRELNLTGRPDHDDMIRWLADSPQLSTLRVLTARALWPQGLAALVASPHLARLRALRLPTNGLGNAGIVSLVRAASLSSLEELDLSGQGVSERYQDDPLVRCAGMEVLVNWPGLSSVRSLNLASNEIGRAGLRALLRSPNATSLKHLSLRGTRLDGQTMAEFDLPTPGPQLESLDLGENVLKDLGVEYIAIVPCLRELKSLRLDRCEISVNGARLFAKKATFIGGLRQLEVGHNHFRETGLRALLERKPQHLHTLGLRDNDVFDEGAELLAGSPASEPLLELDLCRNSLRTDGALALGESPYLQNLLILRMLDNTFNQSDIAWFKESALGRRLKVMELEWPPPPHTYGDGDIPF